MRAFTRAPFSRDVAEGIIKSARTDKDARKGVFGDFYDDHGAPWRAVAGAPHIRLYSKVNLPDLQGFDRRP